MALAVIDPNLISPHLARYDSTVSKPQKLVDMIQGAESLCKIESLLKDLAGTNISTPEVKGLLPEKWKRIANKCLTTPLRSAITWRRVAVIRSILTSGCYIAPNDKNLALQKILRHLQTEEDVEIVGMLLKAGATVNNLSHIHLAIALLFQENEDLLEKFIETVVTDGENNHLGCLLLALFVTGRSGYKSTRSRLNSGQHLEKIRTDHNSIANSINNENPKWRTWFQNTLYRIFLSGFNPSEFLFQLSENENLQNHSLLHALPVLLRLCAQTDNVIVGKIMHQVHRFYPIVQVETHESMKALSRFLILIGYDMKVLLKEANLRRQFSQTFGFDAAKTENRVLSLKELSRIVIRQEVTSPNLLIGMCDLKDFPFVLKNYILLSKFYPHLVATIKQSVC